MQFILVQREIVIEEDALLSHQLGQVYPQIRRFHFEGLSD